MSKKEPRPKLSIVRNDTWTGMRESWETDARILCIEDVLANACGYKRRPAQLSEWSAPLWLDLKRDSPDRKEGICRPFDRCRYMVIDLDSFEVFQSNKVLIT